MYSGPSAFVAVIIGLILIGVAATIRMSQLIGVRVRQRKASRDSLIFKLSKEGWSQREIGNSIGLDQSTISSIIENFNAKEINNLYYKKGIPPEKLTELYRMDYATLWSILLEGKNDLERFKTNNFSTSMTTRLRS